MLSQDDDSDGSLNSRVVLPLNVRPHLLPDVRGAGVGQSGKEGRPFTVSIAVSRVIPASGATTFGTAQLVELSAAGTASLEGNISREGEGHYFRIVPPTAGKLIIRQAAAPNSMLDSLLTIYGMNQNQLAVNDDDPTDKSSNRRLELAVSAGQTYFIRAGNYNAPSQERRTGRYHLTITLAK